MNALSQVVEQGILKLSKSPQYLKNFCTYPWIIEQWESILNTSYD